MKTHLVGALEHEWIIFHSVGNVIIPTDELYHFRGVGIPPTKLIYGLIDQLRNENPYPLINNLTGCYDIDE